MQPDTSRTKATVQWEGSVAFREWTGSLARETAALVQDINEGVYYSNEDHYEVGDELNPSTSVTAQDTTVRKLHLKRAAKVRKLASGAPSRKPDRKENPNEAQSVVKYTESPSWLLEPDGEEVSPLIASPFPHELIKKSLHSGQ